MDGPTRGEDVFLVWFVCFRGCTAVGLAAAIVACAPLGDGDERVAVSKPSNPALANSLQLDALQVQPVQTHPVRTESVQTPSGQAHSIQAKSVLTQPVQNQPDPIEPNPTRANRTHSNPSSSIQTQPSSAADWGDITEAAGLAFQHDRGARGQKYLPESMGAGAAFFDRDGDGDPDLLLVDSGRLPGEPGAQGQSKLYDNDGQGHFRDVTVESGIPGDLYGQGVAAADYDGDGDIDLYLTALGPNRLLRNDGDVFHDVTVAAGVAGGSMDWSTSAGFFDYDLDGDLDLFVCNYLAWSKEIDLELNFTFNGTDRAYGTPNLYEGVHSALYRNDGDGTFTDVSQSAGIQVIHPTSGAPLSKALAVTFADLDGDRFPEILVANDKVQNFLFRNLADGRFEEIGSLSGLGNDGMGFVTSAMGIDVADVHNDGLLAVAIGNFANEMTSFYVQQSDPWQFVDRANSVGIGVPSLAPLTFGLLFLDYDLDGRLDLLQTNGHIEDGINRFQPSQRYRQSAQLFRNVGGTDLAQFALVPDDRSGALTRRIVGRGATVADIDADGDLDLLLTQAGGSPLLLRNEAVRNAHSHWLRLRLIGVGMNRDGIGAVVRLVAGDARQQRTVMPTRSYLSQVDLPVSFGLGDADQVDSLEVLWPDGFRQSVAVDAVNRTLTVRYDSRSRFVVTGP